MNWITKITNFFKLLFTFKVQIKKVNYPLSVSVGAKEIKSRIEVAYPFTDHDMIAVRTDFRQDGIFSNLFAANKPEEIFCYSLEHAYNDQPPGNIPNWKPKVPPGLYLCVLGDHRLHSMKTSFKTYMITGVAGHTNLLFHKGNIDNDSDGCSCLGLAESYDQHGAKDVISSGLAFDKFMAFHGGESHFWLTVK